MEEKIKKTDKNEGKRKDAGKRDLHMKLQKRVEIKGKANKIRHRKTDMKNQSEKCGNDV